MSPRLRVQKTLKLYMGGKFERSESGHTLPSTSREGQPMNVARASRKDLRNSIENLRKVQPGWAGRTAYNRGQILYRLAEMIEDRATSLPTSLADAQAAADRAVHHAGWCDKVTAVLSTLNPVAAAYVNYSQVKPLGIVVAAPDAKDGLLGLVEATCAALVMGNAVALLIPAELGELAAAYGELLHTSDVPGGTVDLLTGDVDELLSHAARHDDLDAIYVAGAAMTEARRVDIEREAARVMRRWLYVPGAKHPAAPLEMQRLAEVQTVWMSTGVGGGGGSAY